MQTRAFNPTPWLQAFNVNHAIEVTGAQRTLYCAGQTATDANGAAMHPGDLAAQFKEAWKNLNDALSAAGMTPANIVRLNYYTTDVDTFMAEAGDSMSIVAAAGCQPVSTLLGVTRLYDPGLMIEIEATAVA